MFDFKVQSLFTVGGHYCVSGTLTPIATLPILQRFVTKNVTRQLKVSPVDKKFSFTFLYETDSKFIEFS